ncbi:MAG: hypothetical protein PHU71_03285 [Candidatus Gracilibacteria bacterium]|nr:hypothetical protein [Candidatus Gracilibacteria bacterium]
MNTPNENANESENTTREGIEQVFCCEDPNVQAAMNRIEKAKRAATNPAPKDMEIISKYTRDVDYSC